MKRLFTHRRMSQGLRGGLLLLSWLRACCGGCVAQCSWRFVFLWEDSKTQQVQVKNTHLSAVSPKTIIETEPYLLLRVVYT